MVPIAFGMLLANIPEANLAVQYHDLDGFRDLLAGRGEFVGCAPGLMDFLYFGVKAGIYPPLIFLGIGAMTDFAPLIANQVHLFSVLLLSLVFSLLILALSF